MKHFHRRLALCLALCLLWGILLYTIPVSASPGVPLQNVTVEPATAAGSFSTALRENMWQYDDAQRSITYRGGWSVGCLSQAGYEHFTHINSTTRTWLTRDTTDQWQSPAGTIDRNSLQMRPSSAAGMATAFGYCAPVGGTVSFSLDGLTAADGGYFAIFVGQRMVFPTEGISFSAADDLGAWYALSNATDATAVNRYLDGLTAAVQEGEVISFAFRTTRPNYQVAAPRITYHTANAPAIFSSRFSFRGENYPTYSGDSVYRLAKNCGGGWSFGSFPRSGQETYTPFSCLDSTFCILNRGGTDQWSYGGLYLQNGVVITAQNYVSVFSYEAGAAGRVHVRVGNITASKSDSGQDILFCILYNDTMLWPQRGGSLTDYTHWYNLTDGSQSVSQATATSNALRDIRVKAGDTIRYCFVARTGHSMTTRDIDLTVAYTEIDSSLPQLSAIGSSLSDHYPLMRETSAGGGLLAYRGRWQYAATPHGEGTWQPLTRTDAANRFLPGADAGEGYLTTAWQESPAAGLMPSARYDLAVTYTLRYSGRLRLTTGAWGDDPGARYTLTLEKNGSTFEQVTGTAAALAAHSFSFPALGGDVLALRLSLPEGEEGGSPLFLAPTIAYQSLTDRVAITGFSMTPTVDLAVQIYTAAAVSYPTVLEHGLLVWREAQLDYDRAADLAEVVQGEALPNNTASYVYRGLTATDMGTTIYLRPYVKTAEGRTLYGSVIPFSIFDYVTALYGSGYALRDRMLTDMLAYGAAAEAYFGSATAPVTDGLSEAQLSCGTQSGILYRGPSKLSGEEDAIFSHFEAISLLLDNRLGYRIYVSFDPYEAENAYLELSESADFKHVSLYRPTNGCFTISNIPIAEAGKTCYIRLRTIVDGRMQYSPTLAFSAESYAADTAELEDRLQDRLCTALLAFSNSARAYAYERALTD